MAALAVVLSVASPAYGYHRDELYFRALEPAWGYLDQPPLTPLLVRTFSRLIADEPWAIRIPATLCAVASVLMVALITRELGGDRRAQSLCAWSYAFAASPLLFGHLMLTSSLDLVVWPLVVWLIIRVLLRAEPGWWLAAGAVVGLSLYNKWLVAALMASLIVGIAVIGPRSTFRSPWPWLSAALALLIATPNLHYQWTHSWPQLQVGAGLASSNAAEVRVQMWPFLGLILGPPLVPVWVVGLVALWLRRAWRPVRFLAVAFAVLLGITFAGGTQVYYPLGLVVVLFAAGWVPVAEFFSRLGRGWRALVVALLVINAVVSALIGLPVLPLSLLGRSPVPSINQTAADQVGWPRYVKQIAAVYSALPSSEKDHAAVVVSNYGEAGAVARYGSGDGLPRAYSGHNQLYDDARPPDDTTVIVMVGGQTDRVRSWFGGCTTVTTLNNQVNVDNEEQGQPIAICRDPRTPWPALWPRFRHVD